jgi:hypothetical protein
MESRGGGRMCRDGRRAPVQRMCICVLCLVGVQGGGKSFVRVKSAAGGWRMLCCVFVDVLATPRGCQQRAGPSRSILDSARATLVPGRRADQSCPEDNQRGGESARRRGLLEARDKRQTESFCARAPPAPFIRLRHSSPGPEDTSALRRQTRASRVGGRGRGNTNRSGGRACERRRRRGAGLGERERERPLGGGRDDDEGRRDETSIVF